MRLSLFCRHLLSPWKYHTIVLKEQAQAIFFPGISGIAAPNEDICRRPLLFSTPPPFLLWFLRRACAYVLFINGGEFAALNFSLPLRWCSGKLLLSGSARTWNSIDQRRARLIIPARLQQLAHGSDSGPTKQTNRKRLTGKWSVAETPNTCSVRKGTNFHQHNALINHNQKPVQSFCPHVKTLVKHFCFSRSYGSMRTPSSLHASSGCLKNCNIHPWF